MRFHYSIDDLFGQRSKVALLRLMVRTRAEHSGRELSRLVGLDGKTCHAALQDLARQGVVECRKVGTAILYKLKDRHVLVRYILAPVFRKEAGFLAAYAGELQKRARIPLVSVILFGSVVRRKERPSSDVDLVLVVPRPEVSRTCQDALDKAMVELSSSYGSPPQIVLFDRREFTKRAKSGDAFVTEVLRTGRVLYGKPISELIKHGT
jgi:predicted nucleotidyltransferase